MVFTKTTFEDGKNTVGATFLNALQDWLLAHKTQHAPGGSDSVFPATGSAGYVHQAADGTLSLTNPAGSGDVVGPDEAIDGHMALFDGTTGKLLKDGGAPSGGGASFWTALTATTDFATTGASTSTITMNTDKTASIPVGSPIKYTYNGTLYYGKITALTSSLMTIAGPAIGTGAGLLTTLSYGDASRIETRTYVIAGAYADAANTALLSSDARMYGGEIWRGPVAYAVAFSVIHTTNDTGATQPTVTPTIAGSDLGTALSVSTTIAKSVVGITSANYAVNKDSAIDIHTTAGTNRNAYDLTVEIDFVKP